MALDAQPGDGEPANSMIGDNRAGSPGAKRVRFTSNIIGPMFLLTDSVCLLLCAPLALLVYNLAFGQQLEPKVHLFAFVVMVVSFLLLRSSRQAYQKTFLGGMDDEGDATFDAVVGTFLTAALVWQFGLIEHYSRGLSLAYLGCLVACLWLSRPLLRRMLTSMARRGVIGQRIAFYGADPGSLAMIERMLWLIDMPHLRFIGVADDRLKAEPVGELPWIGGFNELATLARQGEIDQVFISVADMNKDRLRKIVEELSEVSIDVSLIPPQAIDFSPDYRVNLLGSIPVLTLWQRPFRDINRIVKRAEDVIIGGLALLLASPVMAVAALCIRATTKGPVLFVQPRIGFNNEVIKVIKFRTMYADQSDLQGLKTTSRNDVRITPVGRILRYLSIDELPQLFNVLKGEMSLVGPRPHAIQMKVGDRFYVDAVRGYAGRHRVKPGITGLAQVRGLRGEIRTIERAERRIELDKEYIDSWSVWLDLKIMFATARAVMFDADAY
ncbi:MAG TPA: exopolysaccharide biosynthesis polyprenyl glycosylphosphotransferase [Sphingomicrobium sp.]|nr:exopolysaccharide biosynthesis polyprenyl glycosylphosphotransferase [Sphingomicrobium sp.]